MSDLSPEQVAELIDREKVQLIDVREAHEHAAGRIGGDRLIELGRLSAAAESLSPATPVVFYCRTGARSAMAAEAFGAAGFQAHNLEGGLKAWVAAGLPLEPEGGRVA